MMRCTNLIFLNSKSFMLEAAQITQNLTNFDILKLCHYQIFIFAQPKVMRVNSTNVLDKGLRIGEIGRRMNSKVNQSNKVCIKSKRGVELSLLLICPSPSSPGPYI
jgi:hypothetical protein